MAANTSTVQSSKKLKKGIIVKRITTTTVVEEVIVEQNGPKSIGRHFGNASNLIADMSSKKIRKISNTDSSEHGKNAKWTESDSEDNVTDDEYKLKRKTSNRQLANEAKQPKQIVFKKTGDKPIDDIIKESLNEYRQSSINNVVSSTIHNEENVQHGPGNELSVILETSEIDNTIYPKQNNSINTIASPEQKFSQNIDESAKNKKNDKKSPKKQAKNIKTINLASELDTVDENISVPSVELTKKNRKNRNSKQQTIKHECIDANDKNEIVSSSPTSERRTSRRKAAIAAKAQIQSDFEQSETFKKKRNVKSVKNAEVRNDLVGLDVAESSPPKRTAKTESNKNAKKSRMKKNSSKIETHKNLEELEKEADKKLLDILLEPLSTVESDISTQEASENTENDNLNSEIESNSTKESTTKSHKKKQQKSVSKSSVESKNDSEMISGNKKIKSMPKFSTTNARKEKKLKSPPQLDENNEMSDIFAVPLPTADYHVPVPVQELVTTSMPAEDKPTATASKLSKNSKSKSATIKNIPKASPKNARKTAKKESSPKIEKNDSSNDVCDYSQASTVPLSPIASNISLPNTSTASTLSSTILKDDGIVIYSPSMANKFKRNKSNKIKLTKRNFKNAIENANNNISNDVDVEPLEIEPNQRLIYHPHKGDFESALKESKETGRDILSVLGRVRDSYLSIQND